MAPIVFMPLLRETLPSGPNRIIRNIRTKVFRCKPADDVMRDETVRRTGRKDANLLSRYANYFTRFIEAVASDEWQVIRKVQRFAGAQIAWFLARDIWCVAGSDRGEFAIAQIIIDAAPADGVAGETG